MKLTSKIALSMLTAAAVALAAMPEAHAVPISGTINFTGGGIQLNGDGAIDGTDTAIVGWTGTTVVSSATPPTGSYSTTIGTPVTMIAGGFQFSPTLVPNPVNPLWSFTTGGKTYSFSLSSINVVQNSGGFLNLTGTGTASITGFDDTTGNWELTATGTGPTYFDFNAGNSPIPDSGTSAMLLGLGIIGLGIFAKFRKTAVA